MLRVWAGVLLCVVALADTGCAGPQQVVDVPTEPPPSYAEIAAQYNVRAAKLPTLWAHANVVLRYTDDKGRRRREDVQGVLQIRRPSEIALSLHKALQDVLYIGADEDRFWWFEFGDVDRVTVAKHEDALRAREQGIDLPVHPLQLIALLGIVELPIDAAAGATAGLTRWSSNGDAVIVETRSGDGFQRLWLDTEYSLPSRIELYDREGQSPVLVAELSDYIPARLVGDGGARPWVSADVKVTRPGSDDLIRLRISDPEARSPDRMPDAAFDFDTLRSVYRPATVRVVE